MYLQHKPSQECLGDLAQERRLKLAARANIVGYQLTVDDTVDVIAGELGEATRTAAAAAESLKYKAQAP